MSIVLEPEVVYRIEELADRENRTPSEVVADAIELYDSQKKKKIPGVEFLMSIAGQGSSNEDDVSERDEEILESEVDPIRGWRLGDIDRDSA
jgi:predicted transcriptional regulator